jgi:hypothetical protein
MRLFFMHIELFRVFEVECSELAIRRKLAPMFAHACVAHKNVAFLEFCGAASARYRFL